MLRREKPGAIRVDQLRQGLAIQGILAAIIVVAALFSRHNPTVFWLTLSLLALPLGVSATYLFALWRQQKARTR